MPCPCIVCFTLCVIKLSSCAQVLTFCLTLRAGGRGKSERITPTLPKRNQDSLADSLRWFRRVPGAEPAGLVNHVRRLPHGIIYGTVPQWSCHALRPVIEHAREKGTRDFYTEGCGCWCQVNRLGTGGYGLRHCYPYPNGAELLSESGNKPLNGRSGTGVRGYGQKLVGLMIPTLYSSRVRIMSQCLPTK